MVTAARGASIAQRIDRLPLTWTLWRLALVTQAGSGLVIAIDAIAARIYPFIRGPEHAFDTAEFSILLLVSTAVGIIAGEYLFALPADRFGRKRMLLAYVIIPGALLLARFGIDQRAAPLEAVTGV